MFDVSATTYIRLAGDQNGAFIISSIRRQSQTQLLTRHLTEDYPVEPEALLPVILLEDLKWIVLQPKSFFLLLCLYMSDVSELINVISLVTKLCLVPAAFSALRFLD